MSTWSINVMGMRSGRDPQIREETHITSASRAGLSHKCQNGLELTAMRDLVDHESLLLATKTKRTLNMRYVILFEDSRP